MRKFLFTFLGLIVAALLWGPAAGQEPEAFTESVVIFNTICAKCHEGQCSGRMSFDEAYEASADHIVRHYNAVSDKEWLRRELYLILNHMKEECNYYPMNVPLPPKRVWLAGTLDKMSTLLEKNYFIPLGPLVAGEYRLELDLESDSRISVQLVSESFDTVVEDCYDAGQMRLKIPFAITDPGNHYVRTYPQRPVRILRLAVVPTGQQSQ